MEIKGPFIGFTFGNRHSSRFGIFRTMADRHEISLSPIARDTVFEVPGADGMCYFGSTYSKREMSIPFAFYGLTEKQLQEFKKSLNNNRIEQLILDEEPHKVWSAKLTGISTFKHLCLFRNNNRFYCGEGTLMFTLYYPLARSRYQYLEDYTQISRSELTEDRYYTLPDEVSKITQPAILFDDESEGAAVIEGWEGDFEDWLKEQELLDLDTVPDERIVDSYVSFFNASVEALWEEQEVLLENDLPSRRDYGHYSDGKYHLYNCGDLPMPFKLYIPIDSVAQDITISCGDEKLVLKNVSATGRESFLLIDSEEQVLLGCDSKYNKTNNLYNYTITEGNFFSIPTGSAILVAPKGTLKFDYLYI